MRLLPDRTLTCWTDTVGIHGRLDGASPDGPLQNIVRATVERLPAGFDPALVDVTALSTQADGIPAWRPETSTEGATGAEYPHCLRRVTPANAVWWSKKPNSSPKTRAPCARFSWRSFRCRTCPSDLTAPNSWWAAAELVESS